MLRPMIYLLCALSTQALAQHPTAERLKADSASPGKVTIIAPSAYLATEEKPGAETPKPRARKAPVLASPSKD